MTNPLQVDSRENLLDWATRVERRCHRKANQARFFTLSLKAVQITLAGSIPILALASPSISKPAVNGILGALIVIIEGFQHSFKFEEFWIRYRQAAFDIDAEKVLLSASAGPYENVDKPEAVFAVRVSAINRDRLKGWADTIQKSLAKSG